MRPFRMQRETVRKCVDENNRTFNIGSAQNIYFFIPLNVQTTKPPQTAEGSPIVQVLSYPAYQEYYCQSHYMQTVERRLSKL